MTIASKNFNPNKIIETVDKANVQSFITELAKKNNCFVVADSNGNLSEKEI